MSANKPLSKLVQVPLREARKHEANDFTPLFCLSPFCSYRASSHWIFIMRLGSLH